MCELCDKGETTLREFGPSDQQSVDADDLYCEWMPDDGDADGDELFSCLEAVRYIAVHSLIDEHLCAYHAEREKALMGDGLGEFLGSAGLGQTELIPIREGGVCDYFDVLDPVDCQNKAIFAKRLVDEQFLCERHARREGYL